MNWASVMSSRVSIQEQNIGLKINSLSVKLSQLHLCEML